MSVVTEAERLVLSLSERDRVQLAGKILRSLPAPTNMPDDDGIAEALRRSDELRNDPTRGISVDELDRRMNERFGWKS